MPFYYRFILFLTLLTLTDSLGAQIGNESICPTKAESTDYKETSSYADVLHFIETLQRHSSFLHAETLLTTVEGRRVPLLIVGNPLPAGPPSILYDRRPVIYIQGNIHAGEVEGKEALLMLLREMLLGRRKEDLTKAIFLLVPIFNADGNERISPQNRSYMPNPEKGVGMRANSQNYDLNRDYMKAESREVRAVLEKVFNRWDPLLYIDLHATNGSFHRETVTYFTPMHPNQPVGIHRFLWDQIYPSLDRQLRNRGIHSLPYGTFKDDLQPELGWVPYTASPRIGVDYVGLRNRFPILLEIYAYAPFRVRVEHCLAFLEELLDLILLRTATMKELAGNADHIAAAGSNQVSICLQTDAQPLANPLQIEGYVAEKYTDSQGRSRIRPRMEQEKRYTVPYWARLVPTKSRPLPYAYLLKPGCDAAARQILRHGIRLEQLQQPFHGTAQQFTPASLTVEKWISEGHVPIQLQGEWKTMEVTAEEGYYLIPVHQPLGTLAATLLEPDHPDSLFSWNFFNSWVTQQWSRSLPTLPILRLNEPVQLVSRTLAESDFPHN